MLNILWPIFILISVIYACFFGKIDDLNKSIFESLESATTLIITFFGTICFWSGIMEIAEKSGLTIKISKIF